MPERQSLLKLMANRRNAQKSTGPKTPEGKRLASRNATRHGFFSKDLILQVGRQSELRAEYDELLAQTKESLRPQDTEEYELVARIILSAWQVRRALRFARAVLLHAPGHGEPLSPGRGAKAEGRPCESNPAPSCENPFSHAPMRESGAVHRNPPSRPPALPNRKDFLLFARHKNRFDREVQRALRALYRRRARIAQNENSNPVTIAGVAHPSRSEGWVHDDQEAAVTCIASTRGIKNDNSNPVTIAQPRNATDAT
jgi:hypothetical protein